MAATVLRLLACVGFACWVSLTVPGSVTEFFPQANFSFIIWGQIAVFIEIWDFFLSFQSSTLSYFLPQCKNARLYKWFSLLFSLKILYRLRVLASNSQTVWRRLLTNSLAQDESTVKTDFHLCSDSSPPNLEIYAKSIFCYFSYITQTFQSVWLWHTNTAKMIKEEVRQNFQMFDSTAIKLTINVC